MRLLFATLGALFLSLTSYCQDTTEWLALPSSFETHVDTNKVGKIHVTKDKRIDQLVEYMGTAHSPETEVKLEGFRVQLYFNNDKTMCNQARSKFLAVTNDVRAYIQYQAPHYRLRVGNFRTLLEAEKFRDEISKHFPDAITVNDKIDLPQVD